MDAPNRAEAPPPLDRIVEALLFLGGPPLTAERASEVIRGLTAEQFVATVADLESRYRHQGRPYRIARRDPGYEMELRPSFRNVLDRLHGTTREARLSQTALDTLSLVAYSQPISRKDVDGMRGGDSLALLRQLVRLGLVVVQRSDGSDGEATYSTTRRFLELFGLRSLDDLPRTQELQRL